MAVPGHTGLQDRSIERVESREQYSGHRSPPTVPGERTSNFRR